MKLAYSLRFKLSTFYLIIIVIPVLIISIIMPYYYQYLISKETEKLTESTLASLSNNINTYLDDLSRITIIPYLNENIMFALQQVASNQYETAEPYTQLMVNRALYESLPKYLQFTREDILSMIITTRNGSSFVHSRNSGTEVADYPYTEQDWYNRAKANNGKVTFIPTHVQDYITNSKPVQVFSVARLIKDPETQRPLAVIMADADMRAFEKIIKGIDLNNKSSIITIMDDRGDLFFSSKTLSESLREQIQDDPEVVKDGRDSYVVVSKVIQPSNWKLVVLLSKSEIAAKVHWMFTIGILFAVSGVCITFLLFFVLSRWILRPFQEMVRVMKQVERGHFDVRLQTHGQDEIALLGNAFNTMISKVNDLIDREYRAVLNQRNAEYRALQSQIQPHFLYNTLNGFIGLNRLGDRKTLEKAILSLSSMLRYTLDQADWSTLGEEFKFLEKYCHLQGMRFQERMTTHIYLDGTVSNYKIPKLLLQPLVENAIIHGLEAAEHPCSIHISAHLEEQDGQAFLCISVKDDGAGFDMTKKKEKISVGLSNIQVRLKMAYPGSTFTIHSQVGQGTAVVIQIPEKEVTI
ncbi:sensor histidine kinase [Ectobacillus funiculus]|uniref:cache domain-containing sensor histidine kinase n=1 Tax=Ectobacillus funiculus TaxID=137993 RepID=UPI00397DA8D0